MKVQIHELETDTGEVVKSNVISKYSFFDEKGYLYANGKNQVRLFQKLYEMPVSDVDLAKTIRLMKFLKKDDNCLVKKSNGVYKNFNEWDIYRTWEISERRGKVLLNKLIKDGVIREGDMVRGGLLCKAYFVNPLYMLNSKRISHHLYYVFRDLLVDELPKWVSEKFESDIEYMINKGESHNVYEEKEIE